MPGIEIERDSRDRTQFVLKMLPGENQRKFNVTGMLVSKSSSLVKSYKASTLFGKHKGSLKPATDSLASFLSQDTAENLVKALMEDKVGTRLVFTAKGETEDDGFDLKSYQNP